MSSPTPPIVALLQSLDGLLQDKAALPTELHEFFEKLGLFRFKNFTPLEVRNAIEAVLHPQQGSPLSGSHVVRLGFEKFHTYNRLLSNHRDFLFCAVVAMQPMTFQGTPQGPAVIEWIASSEFRAWFRGSGWKAGDTNRECLCVPKANFGVQLSEGETIYKFTVIPYLWRIVDHNSDVLEKVQKIFCPQPSVRNVLKELMNHPVDEKQFVSTLLNATRNVTGGASVMYPSLSLAASGLVTLAPIASALAATLRELIGQPVEWELESKRSEHYYYLWASEDGSGDRVGHWYETNVDGNFPTSSGYKDGVVTFDLGKGCLDIDDCATSGAAGVAAEEGSYEITFERNREKVKLHMDFDLLSLNHCNAVAPQGAA
eukprot:ANDGO_00764.mRNA.1 hypothetical protein